MKRLDELTQLAIEGSLSADEEAELERLLASGTVVKRRFQELIDTEIALRGLDERLDLSDAVMARLSGRAMPPLSVLPAPPVSEPVSKDSFEGKVERWTLRLIVPIAAAAAVTLAFALFHDRTDFEAPALAVTGTVRVADESGKEAAPDRPLRPGDLIRVPTGAAGTLSYRDETRIDLTAGAEVRVDSDPARGGEKSKSLELVAGTLAAEVAVQPAGQPLVVRTPHAVAVVRGTRFILEAQDDRTRLEVSEGRVDFFAAGATSPAVVTAGRFAEVDPSAGAVVPLVRPLRHTDGLLALYTFEEGSGETVHDRSEQGDALDLTLSGAGADPLEWLPGGGIRFGKKGHLATRRPARKIIEACRSSDEITVEAWVEAAPSVASGPARIVTLSRASERLNFTLAQGDSQGDPERRYVARLRSSKTVADWPAPVGSATGRLSHLVLVREAGGRETFWLDGERIGERDAGGSLKEWFDDLPLGIGDDPGGENRSWRGSCHLVAIYRRALAPAEVMDHHEAGPR